MMLVLKVYYGCMLDESGLLLLLLFEICRAYGAERQCCSGAAKHVEAVPKGRA